MVAGWSTVALHSRRGLCIGTTKSRTSKTLFSAVLALVHYDPRLQGARNDRSFDANLVGVGSTRSSRRCIRFRLTVTTLPRRHTPQNIRRRLTPV